MTIDGTTGRIDYTPALADLGAQLILLVVEDGNGGSASQSFTIVVSDVPPNLPPSITTSPTLLATQDAAYTYDVDATDPEATAITFALAKSKETDTQRNKVKQVLWVKLTETDMQLNKVEQAIWENS